jgi:uncharacterized protein YydD (DUF2326 family)
MIHAVRCNQASFKEVEFRPGFNVILADRTEYLGGEIHVMVLASQL